MDKWDYQNKPRYLENRVVREPCKQRTACTYFKLVGNNWGTLIEYPVINMSLFSSYWWSSNGQWMSICKSQLWAQLRNAKMECERRISNFEFLLRQTVPSKFAFHIPLLDFSIWLSTVINKSTFASIQRQ